MKNRPTPGPWHLSDETPGYIDSEFGAVAKVIGWEDPDDETEPNARLIAKAPKLFEILEQLAEVEGPCSIHEGVLTLEDGTQIDLKAWTDGRETDG